jgi:lipopolysaccharide/colanic/teichoic acid biosynthesis glycosyltransferase
MDIAGSFVGLALMVVLGPFIAIAILIETPGQLFLKQIRVRRNGRIFTILKSRSMYVDADQGNALSLV